MRNLLSSVQRLPVLRFASYSITQIRADRLQDIKSSPTENIPFTINVVSSSNCKRFNSCTSDLANPISTTHDTSVAYSPPMITTNSTGFKRHAFDEVWSSLLISFMIHGPLHF